MFLNDPNWSDRARRERKRRFKDSLSGVEKFCSHWRVVLSVWERKGGGKVSKISSKKGGQTQKERERYTAERVTAIFKVKSPWSNPEEIHLDPSKPKKRGAKVLKGLSARKTSAFTKERFAQKTGPFALNHCSSGRPTGDTKDTRTERENRDLASKAKPAA